MAHDKSDTRLRRSPIRQTDEGKFKWSGGLPQGTSNAAPIHLHGDTSKPIDVDRRDPQVLHGTSNAAMDKQAGAYEDTASPAKPNRPPPGPTPFTLTK